MRKILFAIASAMLFLVVFMVPAAVGADVLPSPLPIPAADQVVPLDQFLQFVFGAIGGFKGASALVIAVIAIQILMRLVLTGLLDKVLGKWKLLTVYGLTVVLVVLAGMTSGMSFVAALLTSQVVAAIQVFVHQLIKQLNEKPQPPAAA